ncbi:MAG: nuclear transport factor 2 family protein [Chitinophagaceae bacterium]
MKNFSLYISFVVLSISSSAQTDSATIRDIETVCNYYLIGGTNGDSIMFSKAFAPDGQMRYMRNDTLMNVSLGDFMARTRNTGVKQNRTTKIESIQVYGFAATAKLTVEYPTFYFHDIMGLLKTKEGWKIVSKIFYREDKAK